MSLRQQVQISVLRSEGGCIINMSSISGLIISKIFPRHNVAYCVSKAGVAHLTRGLASEWAQYNIRVNALAPGYMLTPNTQTSRKYPEIVERLTEMTPMNDQSLVIPIVLLRRNMRVVLNPFTSSNLWHEECAPHKKGV